MTVKALKKYSIIRTYANEDNKSGLHLLFDTKEIPMKNNYEMASNLYHQNIMVTRTDYSKQYFITVVCPGPCQGKLTFYASDLIHLGLNEHFEFKD